MISDEALEAKIFKKLQFLSETDEECAQLEVDTLHSKESLRSNPRRHVSCSIRD